MDINKASAEELGKAFQVDGTRARYIVEHRQKQGSFKSWEDVKQVPGFEDKMVDSAAPSLIVTREEATEIALRNRVDRILLVTFMHGG